MGCTYCDDVCVLDFSWPLVEFSAPPSAEKWTKVSFVEVLRCLWPELDEFQGKLLVDIHSMIITLDLRTSWASSLQYFRCLFFEVGYFPGILRLVYVQCSINNKCFPIVLLLVIMIYLVL